MTNLSNLSNRYDSLDSIVKDMCVIAGDTNYNTYPRLIVAAGRIVDELDFFFFPFSIRSTELEIGDNLAIPYPDDAAVILKVGACAGKGLLLFGRIDKLPEACVCMTTNTDDACDFCYFQGYYGEAYSAKAVGFANGSYEADDRTRMIKFTSGYNVAAENKVVVVYKSTSKENKYKLIPREAFMPIQHGVKELLGDNIQWNFKRKKETMNMLTSVMNPYSIEDLIDAVRGNNQPIK